MDSKSFLDLPKGTENQFLDSKSGFGFCLKERILKAANCNKKLLFGDWAFHILVFPTEYIITEMQEFHKFNCCDFIRTLFQTLLLRGVNIFPPFHPKTAKHAIFQTTTAQKPYPLGQDIPTYRKIPIISPGLTFVQNAFFAGIIFGGAYFRRGLTIKTTCKTLLKQPKTA